MDNDCIVTTEEIHVPIQAPRCFAKGCLNPARPGLGLCREHEDEQAYAVLEAEHTRPLYQTTRTDYEASLKRAEGLRKRLEEKARGALGVLWLGAVCGVLLYDWLK